MTIPPPTDEELIADTPYAAMTERIIGAAMAVHDHFGAGLTEPPYQEALQIELERRGHRVAREVAVPLRYAGVRLRSHYRLDLLVDDVVIVEVKAVEALIPYHRAKLLSCLRAADKPVGLLLNFAAMSLRKGIGRVVNQRPPTSARSGTSASSAFP